MIVLSLAMAACCAVLVRAQGHTRDEGHRGALQAAAIMTGSAAFFLLLAWAYFVAGPWLRR